jgi:hypothetical protein
MRIETVGEMKKLLADTSDEARIHFTIFTSGARKRLIEIEVVQSIEGLPAVQATHCVEENPRPQ